MEGVLLESDSVHDAISKILSAQDDAGIDTVFKLYCNVSSVHHEILLRILAYLLLKETLFFCFLFLFYFYVLVYYLKQHLILTT